MRKISVLLVASVLAVSTAHADDLLDLLQNKGADSKGAPGAAIDTNFGHQKYNLQEVLKGELASWSAEQNIFAGFFNKGDMVKALYQWPSAFDNTSFQNTPTARALYGFLLFENNMPVMGVEALFNIETPEKINPNVIKLWKEDLNETHPAWGVAQIRWSPYWTEVFGPAAEVRVMSRQNFQAGDVEKLKELLKKSAPDTRERALLEWQLVLALSMNDDAASAAKILAHLVKSEKNPIGADLMNMTASRLLYQNGYLDAAIQYYKKVPKSSDYWFDAQEESAWSYIRKGEPQNTLALTKTLVNPMFSAEVGPETVFLQAMAQLKVCDYPAVVLSLKEFKNRFKPRAQAMLAITQDPKSVPAVTKYVAQAKDKTPSLRDIGTDLKSLPRFITRDQRLNDLLRLEKEMDVEQKAASDLYGRSLAEGTAKVGFQARLDEFRQSAEQRRQAAHSAVLLRIKALADGEMKEISQTLQKMQIVEAEVLQQISMSNRLVKTDVDKIIEKKGTTGSHAKDTLTFVAENEVWFDELTNYKVDVKKACQKTH
jgi:hypothetical protein